MGKNKFVYRFFEMLPGLLSWTIMIAPFVVAIIAPKAVAYFILLYTSYWVVNAIWFVINAVRGYIVMTEWEKVDWFSRLKIEYPKKFNQYYYATILPFAKETERVLIPTIDSFVKSKFPKDRKILVLSSEKKLPEGAKLANKLAKKYKDDFDKIVVTEHELAEGEVTGKSSNENWGGRVLDEKCREWGIDPEKVIVCSNDADMSIHEQYMAACLYWLLKQGKYMHTSIIQPVTADHKNIWDTASIIRIRVLAGTLWHAAVPFLAHRLYVFSHYTMTLKMLQNMDFWDPDVIQEDIRTYSKALFRFGTDFRVVPVFLPVEGEPVIGENLGQTLALQYKQTRRWAWGACELANIVTNGLMKKTKAPKWQVWMYMIQYLQMHVDWVIVSYVPMVGTTILFAMNPAFRIQTIGRNLPILLRYILTGVSFFTIGFIILEYRLLKGKPKRGGIAGKIWRLAKWVLSPYTGVVLSSIPALDAQTRLILNKRLQYVVYRKE